MWSILTSGSLTLKVSKDMLCDVLLYFVGWSDCSLLFAAHLLSDCDYLTCSSTTGAELSVLQGMDFSLVSISAIVMESDQSDEAKDAQKVAILTSNGYSCTRVLRNHFCKLHTLLPSAAPERERVYTGARNRYIRSTPTPWEGWSLHVSTWVSQSRPVEATRHTHLAGRGRWQAAGDRGQAGGRTASMLSLRKEWPVATSSALPAATLPHQHQQSVAHAAVICYDTFILFLRGTCRYTSSSWVLWCKATKQVVVIAKYRTTSWKCSFHVGLHMRRLLYYVTGDEEP